MAVKWIKEIKIEYNHLRGKSAEIVVTRIVDTIIII